MKTTLLILTLFVTTAAFGQYYYGPSSISSQAVPYSPPTHPQHAAYAPLASEQSVLAGSSYTMGQGERPASDFPQPPQKSLGELARQLKKDHAGDKKSRTVYVN